MTGTMAKPKKAEEDDGPKKVNRTDSVGVQFYTDPATAKALSDYLASRAEDERPKKRAVITAAIRRYLEERGFWPPK
jgi:acyl-CoA hydrolase